ncbi:hypothetical protein C4566_02200 [Candidatus Parcubacteria bacterium]|nr:MAG: hypothetical protein C4566_02200 [Candidatus Parcubacteria bacterium]
MSNFSLHKIALFKDLSQKEISFLADFFTEKEYSHGDKISQRGAIRDKTLVIVDGLVAIKQNFDGDQTIALFRQYDVLGEMALIDKGSVHSYDLEVASQKLKTLELSVYNWSSVVKKNPELANKVYKNIASLLKYRLTHANNKLWTLFAAGKVIGAYDDLDSMVKAWIEIILQIIPADKIAFMSFSSATRKIQVHKSFGFKLKDNSFFDIDSDPLLSQLNEKPATTILAKDKWPKEYDILPYKCKGLIVSPIKIHRKVIGFIMLGDKNNGKDFSTNNRILLEALANQAAPAIEDVMISEIMAAEKDMKNIYIDPFAKI